MTCIPLHKYLHECNSFFFFINKCRISIHFHVVHRAHFILPLLHGIVVSNPLQQVVHLLEMMIATFGGNYRLLHQIITDYRMSAINLPDNSV